MARRHDPYAPLRATMVERDIASRGVSDPRVLAAMAKVPRHRFVPPDLVELAHEDRPLPIAEHQTISQPYIVAAMTEALELDPADRVLEVGTGSGYAAAVLAELADHVWTIERHPTLAAAARVELARLGYRNVDVICGDGTLGFADAAPYDAIVVTAGGPHVPEHLLAQLADGGRLVIPVGPEGDQELVRVRRHGDRYDRDDLGPVRFVPLTGEDGWPE